MAALHCRDLAKRTTWRIELEKSVFTLGCSGTATVPLPDRRLAPIEASIRPGRDGYHLEDVGRRGLVQLNGASLEHSGSILRNGDRIVLGRIEIVFQAGSEAPAIPEPAVDGDAALASEQEASSRGRWALLVAAAFVLGVAIGVVVTVLADSVSRR